MKLAIFLLLTFLPMNALAAELSCHYDHEEARFIYSRLLQSSGGKLLVTAEDFIHSHGSFAFQYGSAAIENPNDKYSRNLVVDVEFIPPGTIIEHGYDYFHLELKVRFPLEMGCNYKDLSLDGEFLQITITNGFRPG